MKYPLILIFVLVFWELSAQPIKGMRQVKIAETVEPIVLDGSLDELAWQVADKADRFHQRLPYDTLLSRARTEVMLTYDKQFLYIGAICYDEKEGGYAVTSLRRDYETYGTLDFFSVILDPFGDLTNGLDFTVNPYNVQREAIISNGGTGRRSTNTSWDNKWFSKVIRHDDKWVVEMAIPFKTLRFREGSKIWRINFNRNDSKQNERTNWTWIPRVFRSYSLANTGELIWDKPLRKPGKNVSLIPYVTGGVTQNIEDLENLRPTFDAGGDIKVGLTAALNLDLTLNPDFSQVEVDQQVTNLDRFEITFPERRQFFLENNDLFADFGSSSLRPFFTRRIGLAKNTQTNATEENKIFYGARVSGKLDKNWRIGLLNMQTAADNDWNKRIFSTNYTVGVIQRQVFKRSNVSAMFVNKHSFVPIANWKYEVTQEEFEDFDLDEFDLSRLDTVVRGETSHIIIPDSLNGQDLANRIAGIDYNHASADGKWQGKIFYHRSFDQENPGKQFSHGTDLSYNSDRWELRWNHEVVGENYNAEVGFIRRTGYQRINPTAEIKFYPKMKAVQRHGFEVEADVLWSNGYGMTDRTISADYIVRFITGDYVRVGYENDFVELLFDFDPTRTDGKELTEGSTFTNHRLSLFYWSDSRRKWNTRLRATHGQYYNGMRTGIGGDLNYRFQPYGSLAASFSVNRLNMPDPYNDATLLLLGPKIDLTFTNKLFFSTLVQYNNQINNVNINARFQWRFKPASDIFIVYTDNYYADHLKVKNRGIIFKMTYWLNL